MTTSPAQGQPQEGDGFFPAGLVYQQYRHAIRDFKSQPQKLDIPDVDISKHGTYQSYPYYTFLEDNGQKFIVSDGRLLGQLTLIPGPGFRYRKDGRTRQQIAKYRVDILRSDGGAMPSPGTTILSFNDPACGDEVEGFLITKTDPTGTDISETDHYPDLPSGSNSLNCYRLKKPTPDEVLDHDISPWGSSFTPQDHYEPLYYLTGSWNVTRLRYIDYQHEATERIDLFALPQKPSRNWWKATGALSMPWGWFFDLTDYSSDDTLTTMISTSRDLMNAMKRTTGFNISGSVDVSYGIAEAEASFSYNSTDANMTKFNNMHADKTAFTLSQYSHTEYAIVVNKIDLPLSNNFQEAIGLLQDDLVAGTLSGQVLTDFLDTWGTHYAYAVTYGSQGTGTYSLSEDQMSKMVEQGVNYSQAWQANAKVKVMGSGGSIGGGSSSATDQEMQSTFSDIVQDSKDHYICTGGASCEKGGKPTGDPKVPIYLDLRPISQLLGPPFYHDPEDSKIVLELRDRVHDAIQAYAFVKLPEGSPAYGIFKIKLQPPSYRIDIKDFWVGNLKWGEINLSVDSGCKLIPKSNFTHLASDPSALAANFNDGFPEALLFTEGNTITINVTYSLISWDYFNTISRQGGTGPSEEGQAAPWNGSFLPLTISVSSQHALESFELAGSTSLPIAYGAEGGYGGSVFTPTLKLTIESVNLGSLLGVTK